MYSLFDLNVRVVIRELVDCIIKTLKATIDYIDNKQVDSNNKLTLDFIVVKVPTILVESSNNSTN